MQPIGPYESGAVVTTTAIPDSGWEFAGWSGKLSGSVNPASLVIEADTAVTATFETKPQGASGPLRVMGTNPRYFTDDSGRAVYLTGSHTWSSFQDNGGGDPPPVFDYDQYLDFLETNNHNLFRLWTWEESRWTTETSDEDYWFNPMPPFKRVGPGTALDGKPKWDLTQLEQAYFDRMRTRVVDAGERGIYVAVVLFNGWSVAEAKGGFSANNPWRGHPFNAANNINGINGDTNNDNSGEEVHELGNGKLTALQEAYVKKVLDTLNDLDNVLYEISNESHGDATEWQNHMVDFIKEYESTKPKQHPVGMTVEWPGGNNQELFASNADWISPNEYQDPPAADGSKVIIVNTDHIWGIGGDRQWVWKSFTRGLNPIFMDGYDGAGYGVGGAGFDFDDPVWVSLRRNMGYTRSYAERINLAAMTPRNDLCSTDYCLADPATSGAEYLVYLPDGGDVSVDLTSTAGEVQVEWFNPETGQSTPGNSTATGENRLFTAPFAGDAVLYLHQDEPPVERPFKLYLPVVGEGNVSAAPVGPYAGGESVRLTATAGDDWQFEAWTGDLTGDENPTAITITGDMTVTATFGSNQPADLYTLIVNVEGNGSVLVDPPGPFEAGQLVTLTAVPEAGWTFVRWYGEQDSVKNPTTLGVNRNATITAVFHAVSLYLPYQTG